MLVVAILRGFVHKLFDFVWSLPLEIIISADIVLMLVDAILRGFVHKLFDSV